MSVFVNTSVSLPREWGTDVELKLTKYPRMKLKRDLMFGTADVLGTYFEHK
jgi:hypothetical protein